MYISTRTNNKKRRVKKNNVQCRVLNFTNNLYKIWKIFFLRFSIPEVFNGKRNKRNNDGIRENKFGSFMNVCFLFLYPETMNFILMTDWPTVQRYFLPMYEITARLFT